MDQYSGLTRAFTMIAKMQKLSLASKCKEERRQLSPIKRMGKVKCLLLKQVAMGTNPILSVWGRVCQSALT